MKTKLLLFLFSLTPFILFSQQNEIIYTDISPDGKSISNYKSDEAGLYGRVEILSDSIPFGQVPEWSSILNRQIGGMAWGDYDNDGDLDLATGCYFSNSYPPIPEYEVLIYRNDNGVLTNTPAWISTDMRSTTDVKFADINGDNKPELLAANGDNSYVPSVIYMNGESGLNTTPGWISSGGAWTVGAAFCDIDNDGDLDMAFGNQGNSIIPYKPIYIFNNNSGSFPNSPNWMSYDEMITNSVAFGDLNNQNLMPKIIQYTADGSTYAFHIPLYPIYSIDSVYINDVPYSHYCYNPIGCWISLGTKPQAGAVVKIKYTYVSMGDLAASKWVNYQSGVYYNVGGFINNFPDWTVGNIESQKGIVWADFDKDGFQDLAISGSGTQAVIYKNVNGVLTGPVWTSNCVNPSVQELISGDLDRDGYPELAIVNFGTKRIEIFKNNAGVLTTEPSWLYIAGTSATSISFGDVNGDGYLDLAVGTARTPVVVFINQSVVPVELTSLGAIVDQNKVNLHWNTATETNNQGFEVQRNSTSEELVKIGFVEGSGTSTEPHSYLFTDKDLAAGVHRYRLKQIDFDGKSSYSKIIEAEINSPAVFFLGQNYPNPFNPATTISFNLAEKSIVKISVFNSIGEEVAVLLNEQKESGNYNLEFRANNLPSGVYVYKMSVSNGKEGFMKTKKMILLK